jgi:hypothetical protein
MTLSRRGIIKGIYYVDCLCAIQILLGRDNEPLLGGVLYARGSYSEGGSYMLVYTVLPDLIESQDFRGLQ